MRQKTQFVWNDERIQIFNLLLAGMAKRHMKARGHYHEKIKRGERQIKTSNYPPQVKKFDVLVHI